MLHGVVKKKKIENFCMKGHYQQSKKATHQSNKEYITYLIKNRYPEYIKNSYNSTTTKQLK